MHRYLSSISPSTQCPKLLRKHRERKFIGHLCAGQPGAWVQLVERWSPSLYSYITYNVGNEDDTRKLMQLILSEVIHTVIDTPRIKSLTILIFSIAYRHILHYRWQHPVLVPAALRTAPQMSSTTGEDVYAIGVNFIRHFRQFPPETQQLLLLRYICGVTLAELSQIVGQSEDMLAQTLYQAKLYLQ